MLFKLLQNDESLGHWRSNLWVAELGIYYSNVYGKISFDHLNILGSVLTGHIRLAMSVMSILIRYVQSVRVFVRLLRQVNKRNFCALFSKSGAPISKTRHKIFHETHCHNSCYLR